jgi:hypothetical protein
MVLLTGRGDTLDVDNVEVKKGLNPLNSINISKPDRAIMKPILG